MNFSVRALHDNLYQLIHSTRSTFLLLFHFEILDTRCGTSAVLKEMCVYKWTLVIYIQLF